jgi:hypothetical protein
MDNRFYYVFDKVDLVDVDLRSSCLSIIIGGDRSPHLLLINRRYEH